jgi:hypothetical protein
VEASKAAIPRVWVYSHFIGLFSVGWNASPFPRLNLVWVLVLKKEARGE